MSSIQRTMARAAVLVALAVMFAPIGAARAQEAPGVLTGFLMLFGFAVGSVVVVVLVDQSKGSAAGSVIGLQRIDSPGGAPIAFEIPYDPSAISSTGSYAVFASLQGGPTTFQNLLGVPVITGGPSSDVQVPLAAVPAAGA
ncbi:MAG TPA: YbaY family lipoprotein, partial [Actinomycetota bacterium]|nr:YbaY family lipoprotein [Actinomycetota bacterium]